ncbi:hypothetical protein ACFLQW_00760 [Candidatus Zixiibacteriota bacterium]
MLAAAVAYEMERGISPPCDGAADELPTKIIIWLGQNTGEQANALLDLRSVSHFLPKSVNGER